MYISHREDHSPDDLPIRNSCSFLDDHNRKTSIALTEDGTIYIKGRREIVGLPGPATDVEVGNTNYQQCEAFENIIDYTVASLGRSKVLIAIDVDGRLIISGTTLTFDTRPFGLEPHESTARFLRYAPRFYDSETCFTSVVANEKMCVTD